MKSQVSSVLLKKLIQSIWDNIDYWEKEKDLTLRERLEGVVFATLCSIDGEGSPYIPFRLTHEDEKTGQIIELEGLHEKMHDDAYKKAIV